MDILILGLVIFFAIHLMPTFPTCKQVFTRIAGAKGYRPLFALISAIGLVLIVIGYANKPMIGMPEWMAPSWARHLMYPAIWLAFVLLPAAHMPTNIKRFTRHPMLWGITIWSGMHLWLNGDQASILMFGSFLIYSLWAMFSANMRGAKKQTKKVPVKKDVVVLMAGTTVFVVVLFTHKWIAGVPLINI